MVSAFACFPQGPGLEDQPTRLGRVAPQGGQAAEAAHGLSQPPRVVPDLLEDPEVLVEKLPVGIQIAPEHPRRTETPQGSCPRGDGRRRHLRQRPHHELHWRRDPGPGHRRLKSPRPCSADRPSGGGRESNPPGSFRPLTGFEDRGTHQASGRLRHQDTKERSDVTFPSIEERADGALRVGQARSLEPGERAMVAAARSGSRRSMASRFCLVSRHSRLGSSLITDAVRVPRYREISPTKAPGPIVWRRTDSPSGPNSWTVRLSDSRN
jgi:hypothetical protein